MEIDWSLVIKCVFFFFVGTYVEEKTNAYIINNAQEFTEDYLIKITKIKPHIAKVIRKASISNQNNSTLNSKEIKKEKKSKYNEENILREKQEIIKRNTAKDKVCGLSENGECKFIGYCKFQRKFSNYGSTESNILCMREGKGE